MILGPQDFEWESLDQSIQSQSLYIANSPLSSEELEDLLQYYMMLKNNDLLRQAKIGRGILEQKASSIRNDYIFWIDDWSLTNGLHAYSKFLNEVIDFFIQNFRLPLKRFESHLACYPPGSFYKKHYDQHEKTMHRQISIILYLTNYERGHGGELILYPQGSEPVMVTPQKGKVVIYPSRGMLHEVLPSHHERVSMTSWMRDDIIVF
jgi:SM-20-related protein